MILSVRGALLWSFAERYASLVVTIASTMVLARLLTPTQVGIFSLCAAVTTVAGILRDFGVSEYLIQEKDLTRDKLRAAFGIAILIAWSIGAVVFSVRGMVARYFGEPGVADVLAVLSLNFLILPFASPAFALLNREMEFRKIFVVQTISNTVQSVAAVGMAHAGYGYMSLAWAPVVSVAVQTLLLSYFRPRDTLLIPTLKQCGGVLRYGSMFISSRLIETLNRNSHEFLIAKFFGFNAVGMFSRAFGFMDLLNNNLTSAVQRVATPAFASNHRAGKPIAEHFSRGTALLTCIAWPMLGYIALMSDQILIVLFGQQWRFAASTTTILAIGAFPVYLSALAPNALVATGNIRSRLRVILIVCPIHISLLVIASRFNLEAMAAVWLLSNSVGAFLNIKYLHHVLNTGYLDLIRTSIVSSGLSSILTIGVQVFSIFFISTLKLNPGIEMIIVGITSALTWIAAIHLAKHPIKSEIRQLFVFRRKRIENLNS